MKIQYLNEKHKHLPHPKIPVTEEMVWDVIYDYLNSQKMRIDSNLPEYSTTSYVFPYVASVLYAVSDKNRNIGIKFKSNRRFFFKSKEWEKTVPPCKSEEIVGKIYLDKRDRKNITQIENLINAIDKL